MRNQAIIKKDRPVSLTLEQFQACRRHAATLRSDTQPLQQKLRGVITDYGPDIAAALR